MTYSITLCMENERDSWPLFVRVLVDGRRVDEGLKEEDHSLTLKGEAEWENFLLTLHLGI